MLTTATPQQVLGRLMDGFLVTQLLHTFAALGVADVLADGPMTGPAVAQAVGADPGRLTRVLRGLAPEGIVTEEADDTFSLTPVGAMLRRDVPGSMRALAIVRGEIYAHAAGALLPGVRDGVTPFELAYGEPFFAHLARDDDHGEVFGAAMAGRAEHEAEDVVAAYDFAGAQRVVDVGGGHGVLLSAILRATPEASGVLVDTPATLAAARRRLRSERLDERVDCVEGDFFAAIPSGGDCYVLSRVLHDWEDEPATAILATCRAAMSADARLVVIDAILPERAVQQPPAIRMDVTMLILLGARERTAAQFERLLADAGFAVRRTIRTDSPVGLGVIEAVPAP